MLNHGKLHSQEKLEDDEEMMQKIKHAYKPMGLEMYTNTHNKVSKSSLHTVATATIGLTDKSHTLDADAKRRYENTIKMDADTLDKHRQY